MGRGLLIVRVPSLVARRRLVSVRQPSLVARRRLVSVRQPSLVVTKRLVSVRQPSLVLRRRLVSVTERLLALTMPGPAFSPRALTRGAAAHPLKGALLDHVRVHDAWLIRRTRASRYMHAPVDGISTAQPHVPSLLQHDIW